MQGNILLVSGFPAILPSQVILPSGNVIAVSSVAVVRIWYNKTIVALVQGKYDILFTLGSKCYPRACPQVKLSASGEQIVILSSTRAIIVQ